MSTKEQLENDINFEIGNLHDAYTRLDMLRRDVLNNYGDECLQDYVIEMQDIDNAIQSLSDFAGEMIRGER